MKVPLRYESANLMDGFTQRPLGVGEPVKVRGEWISPPFGYLPLSLFDRSDGDSTGFYWPIGRENIEPLVCDWRHDYGFLAAVATSLEALVPLRMEQGAWGDDKDLVHLALRLNVPIPPPAKEPYDPLQARPEVAWESPWLLYEQAKVLVERQELLDAERRVRRSIHLLPEYSSARFLLVKLLRRGRRLDEAVVEMIETCCSPMAFGQGQEECLQWLKRMPDSSEVAPRDDPFWARRHEIDFSRASIHSDQLALFEDLASSFIGKGLAERAVRWRVAIGERFGSPLRAISEQLGYTENTHFDRAEAELRQVGLDARADAVRSRWRLIA